MRRVSIVKWLTAVLYLSVASTSSAQQQVQGADGASALPPLETKLSLAEMMRHILRTHPLIAAARAELAMRAAEADLARGAFDAKFLSKASHAHDVIPLLPLQRTGTETRSTTDTTDLSVGMSVPTMWGTSIVPSTGLTRIHSRAPGALPFSSLGPEQQAHAELSVTQPLLRGAGRTGAASAVDAGRLYRDAAVHVVAHTAQQQLYSGLIAYFELVAAEEQLKLLRASEMMAQQLVTDAHALVESEQRPRSDLRQLEANLANRRRAVMEAENVRLQAAYVLGLAMGIGAIEAGQLRARDGFPDVFPAYDRDRLIQTALNARSDLEASRISVTAASTGLRGAEHNLAPALDLGASVGYRGALNRDGMDAYFESVARNVRGINFGVSMSLELPLRNTAAIAQLNLRRAQLEHANVTTRTLEREVPIGVEQAGTELRLSAAALGAAREVVTQYGQVVADQREKLRAGVGTVTEIVITEGQLVTAQQNQTQTQLRCAIAFSRLLYEIGALPSEMPGVPKAVARLTQGTNVDDGQ